MNMRKIIGRCSNPTHIKYSGEVIDLSSFEYHGCWNCGHFIRKGGSYMTVKEVAGKNGVSETTIRRQCRSGDLDAYLCERIKNDFQLGSNKLWLIFDY